MILTVAILLAGAGTGYAQSQDANSRKMARKQMKAEQDARDRLAFEEARKAIEAKEFVLEADQVELQVGFDGAGFVQYQFRRRAGRQGRRAGGFRHPRERPQRPWRRNGLGQHLGLQAERGQEGEHPCVDERHRHRGFPAQVYINLPNGGNQASVDISPNFNSRRITLRGELLPLSEGNIFQGRTF